MTTQGRRLAVVGAAFLCLLAGADVATAAKGKPPCNAGRGNGYEFSFAGGLTVDGQPNDCDPGNSGSHNHGGDANPIGV